jgi:hypothetical protein
MTTSMLMSKIISLLLEKVMRKSLISLLVLFTLASCATVPEEAVVLSDTPGRDIWIWVAPIPNTKVR